MGSCLIWKCTKRASSTWCWRNQLAEEALADEPKEEADGGGVWYNEDADFWCCSSCFDCRCVCCSCCWSRSLSELAVERILSNFWSASFLAFSACLMTGAFAAPAAEGAAEEEEEAGAAATALAAAAAADDDDATAALAAEEEESELVWGCMGFSLSRSLFLQDTCSDSGFLCRLRGVGYYVGDIPLTSRP